MYKVENSSDKGYKFSSTELMTIFNQCFLKHTQNLDFITAIRKTNYIESTPSSFYKARFGVEIFIELYNSICRHLISKPRHFISMEEDTLPR